MHPRYWRDGALIGGLIGLAVTALLFLLSQFRIVAFVPLDVANAIIALTPGDIATQTIETLGPWGMRALIIGSLLGFVAAFALLSAILARILKHRTALVPWLIGGWAGAGIALGLTLLIERLIPANRAIAPAGVTPILVLLIVYGVAGAAIGWLDHGLFVRAIRVDDAPSERRIFLLRSAAMALALATGSGIAAWLAPKRQIAHAGRVLPTSPPAAPTPTAAPAPTTAAPVASPGVGAVTPTVSPPTATPIPAFLPAPGMRPEITAQDSLYLISSATRDPEVDPGAWRLKIFGAVDHPYELTYDALLALPRQDQTSTLECISNEVGNLLIGNCNWNGVRLRDLLDRAGVQAGVIDIVFRAAEGYSESLPLADAIDANTLVAYGIDGMALTVPHGFPARLRIAGKYGVKNVKWLTEIEAVREDYQGYWQQRGWTDDATIFTTAVYDTGNSRLGSATLQRQDGMVALGGIAFAGDRGIRSVEVQIDGGAWRPARLKATTTDVTWRFWRYDWRDAQPGTHALVVRAVDGAGEPQTAEVHDTHPNGATGYHAIEVEVA